MRVLESITQLTLSVWLGAMAGFGFTAPLIFDAFAPERQRAGDLAGQMIWRINSVGLVLGAIALLALLPRLRHGLNKWRALLVSGALALSLVTAFYIFPQIEKAQPPLPIEQYAVTDPIRVNYNRWHNWSERVFGAALVLGAGALLLGPFGKERR